MIGDRENLVSLTSIAYRPAGGWRRHTREVALAQLRPLEPSRIELLYPDMSADFEYQVFYGVAGSHTIHILATRDWYEPGNGEAAVDASVTVED